MNKLKISGEMTIDLDDYIGDSEEFNEIVSASSEDDHKLMQAAQNLYNYYDATSDSVDEESKESVNLFDEYEKERKAFAKSIIKNFLEITFKNDN